jgi:hypothetical protein
VSLVPQKDEVTWGIAYKVPADAIQKTIEYLDFREKAGYEVKLLTFNLLRTIFSFRDPKLNSGQMMDQKPLIWTSTYHSISMITSIMAPPMKT